MPRYHYPRPALFMLLILLSIFSIPTGVAPTWAQAAGDATCGSTWETTLRIDSFYSVTYGAGLYVSVGLNGAIQTSPDGVNWTRRDSGGADYLMDVAWGGNQFVAVGYSVVAGYSGTILTSPDGVTWTPRTSGGTYYLRGVTWGNHQFVAVGYSGTILTSPDGVTWTPRASGGAYTVLDVTWGNNQFVAVGLGYSGSPGAILTSPDGVTWTPRASGVTDYLSDGTWSGNQFVAVGGQYMSTDTYTSTILTSPDGVTWTPRASGGAFGLGGVTWSGNQFVAVGGNDTNGTILTSPDGVTWTPRAPGVTSWLGDVTWSGAQFVVVGANGAILTSPDGVTWTPRASGVTDALWGVAWGSAQFVVVGDNGAILTSPDGVNWTRRDSGGTAPLTDVTWSSNQFVAVGYSGTMLTSPDGVTWTPRALGGIGNLFSVTWSGSQFMAVGDIILRNVCTVGFTPPSTTGGASFSVMNDASGTVAYATGLNTSGQLGAGPITDTSGARAKAFVGRRIYPVRVYWPARRASQAAPMAAPLAADTPDFIALASATAHTLALRGDGSVWAWGDNASGQLGNGTTNAADQPIPVLSDSSGTPLTGVVAIAAGRDHSVAVKTNGTVWTWGHNHDGQLGDNSAETTTRLYPVQVLTGAAPTLTPLSGVKMVAASDVHTVALKADGTVWAWGHNAGGYLGTGDTTSRRTAVQVLVLNDVQAIVARGTETSARTLAQRRDGSLWGWGDNRYCQLGDTVAALGNAILTPVRLVNLSALGMGLSYLAQGDSHGLARKPDGSVWSWGGNAQGQVGDGSKTTQCAPIQVPGVSNVETVGAGVDHSLVTLTDGAVWGWGNNDQGQLGVGDTTSRAAPTQMKGEGGVGVLDLKPDPTILPGDVNSDGSVNALDVVAVINAVLGIQPLPAADVNGDGAVNALDVVFVINKVLGL